MLIKLFDSRTKQNKELIPVTPGEIKIYVCGVTPYDTNHIGHLFVFTVFDSLIKFLKNQGYKVHYVQNVTDVDDPLFRKAREAKINWKDLTQYWMKYMFEDMKTLGIDMPDHLVYSSDEIDTMVEIISTLLERQIAYKAGSRVYFDTKKFPSYGQMCRCSYEDMLKVSADRGNDINDPNKKDPLDFVLWQESADDEPSWDTPFGKGRPGWHIECSAMSYKYLGEKIDIHGGGADLLFPHHESEIAQTESYLGKVSLVNHWMHIGMVHYNGEKMSKSLGNLVSLRELTQSFDPGAIRYFLLKHHYSLPWEFKFADLERATGEYKKLMGKIDETLEEIPEKFLYYLSEDFSTDRALNFLLNEEKVSRKALEVLGIAQIASTNHVESASKI